jgi:hypothetical protein
VNRAFTAMLFSVIAFAHNASCAGISDSGIERQLRLNVGQTQLRLEDHDGMCHAIAQTKLGSATQYALDIPWPCGFHTDKAGLIRTIQETGYVYVLVESSRPTASLSKDCETHLRSIRIKETNIEVSRHKDRVASCPPFQWDTILFKELFN